MPKKSLKQTKKTTKKQNDYGAKDIYVLKGLDPVRKRPGMYIGSTGPSGLHHLIYEVTDNSLDEAMAGYANEISVTFLPGNKVKCTDNGRGIPVGKHKQTGKSALETVMTTLHAGGKFGGDAYKVSGGLHGVGVSVVCALSKYMRAEVCRDKFLYAQEYAKGKVKTKVKKIKACKQSGTAIIFEPDPEIFKTTCEFNRKIILNHLRQQAYLTPGVKIKVIDERIKPRLSYNFYFEGGLKSYISYLLGGIEPRHDNVFYCKGEKEGMDVEVSLQYAKEMEFVEESFANNIYTGEGGSHLTGFRTALTRHINNYARKNNFLREKDENLTSNDVREGLVAAVSVKIREPQFEGQTKAKLGNPEARVAVEGVFGPAFAEFLEKNPSDARSIIENCLLSARARRAAKAARTTVLRKGVLDGLTLPGKLADCASKDPSESELYIVEGDSAGGSGRQARDSRFQAILPLRGKILNVERARLDRILSSEEIKSLIVALGTAISQDFDINKLRYNRIILMTDADSITGDTSIFIFDKKENNFFLTQVDKFIKNCKDTTRYQLLSFNQNTKKLELKEILQTIRHPLRTDLYEIKTYCGYPIKATDCHSVYVYENNEVKTKKSSQLKEGDVMVFPKKYPHQEKEYVLDIQEEVLGLTKKNVSIKVPRQYIVNIPSTAWCELVQPAWAGFQQKRETAGISRMAMGELIGIYDKVIQQWEQKIDNVMPRFNQLKSYLNHLAIDINRLSYNIYVPLQDWNGRNIPEFAKFYYNNHTHSLKTKFKLDKDFAYLLGWFLGDGCATPQKKNPNRFSICINESKAERYIKELSRIIKKKFDSKAILEYRAPNNIVLHFHSFEFGLLLKKLGLLGKKCNEKFIPNIFFNVKKEVQDALLRGLLQSDGFITVWTSKKTGRTKSIYGWQLSSEELIKGILTIFRQRGIFSGFSVRKNKDHRRKDGVMIKSNFNSYNLTISTVDYLMQTEDIWKGHKDADKLIKYFKKVDCKKLIGKFVQPISNDFVGLKVRSIEKIKNPKDEWVYDFSVAGHQNFIAGIGGCLLHNTDGAHIRTLLLTLFYRHFKEIVEKGYLYIAQPPLYKIQTGKRVEYAYNEVDKKEIVSDMLEKKKTTKGKSKMEEVELTKNTDQENVGVGENVKAVNIQRYKGLGEMNPEELWETTMDPENRILLQVKIEEAKEADHLFDTLMGKEVMPRKKFIQSHAKKVKNLDI